MLRDEHALRVALECGDLSQVDNLLKVVSPHIHYEGGRTPLMVATTHSNPSVAVKLIDRVMNSGAVIHKTDGNKRHVLLHACHSGVDPIVIDRLMYWNSKRGGWQLEWWHRDQDGFDAVALASKAGHGRLAAHLLDKVLDLDARPIDRYPLRVLEVAIESGHEDCALEVLTSSKIRMVVSSNVADQPFSRGSWQTNCTVYSCVAAAVERGMPKLVAAMDNLNHGDVARATWYALYSRPADSDWTATPEIDRMARQYRRDCKWQCVRIFVLLRHRGMMCLKSGASPTPMKCNRSWPLRTFLEWLASSTGANSGHNRLTLLLATLPDALFQLLLQFVLPTAADEFEHLRFWLDARRCQQCEKLCIPNECRRYSG